MAFWYYGENGQQIGPMEDEALRTAISQGRLNPQTLVWREGMAVWQPLAQVGELSMPLAAPAAYHPQAAARTSGLAIASLVCGIVGLVTCFYLVGIAAVICGHLALVQIKDSPVPVGGRGMTIAGLVMGYIQVLACVAFITALVVGAFS